jgi:Ca2+-binding EF-hand superfamily protein
LDKPDAILELLEAIKLLDPQANGTINITRMRNTMTQLSDMDESQVDDMVKELEFLLKKNTIHQRRHSYTGFP